MLEYIEIYKPVNLYGQTIICLFESLSISIHIIRKGKNEAEQKLYPKIYVLKDHFEKAWNALVEEGFDKFCIKNGELIRI